MTATPVPVPTPTFTTPPTPTLTGADRVIAETNALANKAVALDTRLAELSVNACDDKNQRTIDPQMARIDKMFRDWPEATRKPVWPYGAPNPRPTPTLRYSEWLRESKEFQDMLQRLVDDLEVAVGRLEEWRLPESSTPALPPP